ncbi:YndJ family transporter [candidate division KSB1 bacterium]|nr:YndJ family transporter [candidate division KSB1 bacterium]
MPCFLAQPSTKAIREFVARQSEKPFSYSEVGYSRDFPPRGYVVDHRRICLGKGLATFEAACAALRSWEMFNLGWVRICWPDTRLVPGLTVAVVARCFGLWWLNACRIIYVIDESSAIRKFGFAYGTLLECFAACLTALAGSITAWLHLRLSMQKAWPSLTRSLWAVAAISLLFSMILAALYGCRFYFPVGWLDIPWMRVLHGTANALGFGLAGVAAWSLTNRALIHSASR